MPDAYEQVAVLIPPPQYARLHQDLLSALGNACEALRTAVDREGEEATMAAMADAAEDLRIVGARIGREIEALGPE